MSDEDKEIIEKAAQWATENEGEIAEKVVFSKTNRNSKQCIFMAGAPGAGKTETVREAEFQKNFIILEADAIREMNPYYKRTEGNQKGNAHLLQKAASIGLNYCRKICIENNMAFLQDTTFQNSGSRDLVKKLLKSEWEVNIFFVFQSPKDSWQFTQAREKREGRNIPKESFAESFTNIYKNLEYIQNKHPEIAISLVIKEGRAIKKNIPAEGKSIGGLLVDSGIAIPSKDVIMESIEGWS